MAVGISWTVRPLHQRNPLGLLAALCSIPAACGGRIGTDEGSHRRPTSDGTVATGEGGQENSASDRGGAGGAGGNDVTATAVAVGGVSTAAATSQVDSARVQGISVGSEAACAWRNDGIAWCWGDAFWAILGESRTDPPSRFPRVVAQLPEVRAIAVAKSQKASPCICAAGMDGGVRCLGKFVADIYAESGANTPSVDATDTAANVTHAVSVGVAADHACALLDDGTVRCWGYNDFGQLGNGTVDKPGTAPHLAAEVVVGVTGAESLSVGPRRSCVVLTNRAVKCWGWDYGQDALLSTPTNTGLTNVKQVSIGDNFTCAVFYYGAMSCWGDLTFGTGYPSFYSPDRPSQGILGRFATLAVAAGYHHYCELHPIDTVECSGQAYRGILGNDSSNDDGTLKSETVVHTWDTIAIDAGSDQTCALSSSGSVSCWGAKTAEGWTQDSATPVWVDDPLE